MEIENQAFAQQLNKFCAHGLFKEVYRSEKAIVCNVFNQFYWAFSLDLLRSCTKDFPGFIMNATGLRNVVEDERFLIAYYRNLSEQSQNDMLRILNEDFYQSCLARKEKLLSKPISTEVDLQLEEALRCKGKAALQQETP